MYRRGEYILWATGILLLSLCSWNIFRYRSFELAKVNKTQNVTSMVSASSSRSSYIHAAVHRIGRLEINSIGLSVLVVDGDENEGLEVAAVHLAGSAVIGSDGNAVIAGHRDTAFWPLRRVRVGDHIGFERGKEHVNFAVESIRIVTPEDLSVLDNSANRSTLTLITCYPFRFVGGAPKRFVVKAKRI